jgi:hypothetical protein
MKRIKEKMPLTLSMGGRVSGRHRRFPGRPFHLAALVGALAAFAAAAAPAQAGPFTYVQRRQQRLAGGASRAESTP